MSDLIETPEAADDVLVIDHDATVEAGDFFAPAATDLFDVLIGEYRRDRQDIAAVAAFGRDQLAGRVMSYFLEGNATEDRGRRSLSVSAAQLFDEGGAVAALNSTYWGRALAKTDVLDLMPQARRTEWYELMRAHKCPDFEETTVRATLTDLLAMRAKFFAERVDGIFRGLSGEHLTNSPAGFWKRMIVADVLDRSGFEESRRCGLINDLRCVIARFRGAEEPKHYATSPLIRALRGRWGEWCDVDGGALRLRLYRRGTVHIEVHPLLAYRLNQVLASLYPMAIPAQFRQRPKRVSREFAMLKRPIPHRVLDELAECKPARERVSEWPERYRTVPNTIQLPYRRDANVRDEVLRVLEALGGAVQRHGSWVAFDYDPTNVLADVVVAGTLPDERAHQFYPTPGGLAARLLEFAGIDPTADDGATYCEPSAGQGGLAGLLPRERTTCIEVSDLNARILEAKGYRVQCADFLALAPSMRQRFDCIVMNPPFSGGRALAHVEAAALLLAERGTLAAILPASARGADIGAGLRCTWSAPLPDEFPGVSVDVVMLRAQRAA